VDIVESCIVNGPTFVKLEPETVIAPARPEMFENEEAVALREERLRVETDCKLDRVADRVSVDKLFTRVTTLSVSVT
jgi:hypothetical protein